MKNPSDRITPHVNNCSKIYFLDILQTFEKGYEIIESKRRREKMKMCVLFFCCVVKMCVCCVFVVFRLCCACFT